MASLTLVDAAEFPATTITNGQIEAKIYLPQARDGFYRGTRFDHSGIIYSLKFAGHDYYGPWFTKIDPGVHDFIYQGGDIVAGACSAITGPVDEFKPLGWENANPGGTFVKIGIGALRKPDDQPYDNYRLYDVADPGKWRTEKERDSIEFVHTLNDASSGFGYVYSKTLQLTNGKAEMILRHRLRNTGTKAIETTVYNHNFLVLDERAPGPGVVITFPFRIESPHPPNASLAEIRGNQIVYLATLKDHDVVAAPVAGFQNIAEDNQVRIENSAVRAGMTIRSDRPLVSESLWSIRSVIAVEPFIAVTVEPGKEFTWTSTYEYYTMP